MNYTGKEKKRQEGKRQMCSLSNKGRRAGCEEGGRVSDEKVEATLSLVARVLFSRVHSVDFNCRVQNMTRQLKV